MPPDEPPAVPRLASEPVELVAVDRSRRAVLQNLGQLFRHDLSEAYRLAPNADGTFNNRRMDLFLAGSDPGHRAWLITAAGALAGFAMAVPVDGGGMALEDLFVVRAFRRSGVGRTAAAQLVALFPGSWTIAFQS